MRPMRSGTNQSSPPSSLRRGRRTPAERIKLERAARLRERPVENQGLDAHLLGAALMNRQP